MRLGDFIDRVCEQYGCSESGPPLSSLSERGRFAIRFISRTDSKGEYHVAVIQPHVNCDTEISDPVLLSLCEQLGIDPGDFGIAEKKEDPEDDL